MVILSVCVFLSIRSRYSVLTSRQSFKLTGVCALSTLLSSL